MYSAANHVPLTEKQYRAVVLRRRGWRVQVIARKLGVSKGAASRLLTRAAVRSTAHGFGDLGTRRQPRRVTPERGRVHKIMSDAGPGRFSDIARLAGLSRTRTISEVGALVMAGRVYGIPFGDQTAWLATDTASKK